MVHTSERLYSGEGWAERCITVLLQSYPGAHWNEHEQKSDNKGELSIYVYMYSQIVQTPKFASSIWAVDAFWFIITLTIKLNPWWRAYEKTSNITLYQPCLAQDTYHVSDHPGGSARRCTRTMHFTSSSRARWILACFPHKCLATRAWTGIWKCLKKLILYNVYLISGDNIDNRKL